MQQKRSLIFQGFSRKVDNFYRFSVQLNAEFRYIFVSTMDIKEINRFLSGVPVQYIHSTEGLQVNGNQYGGSADDLKLYCKRKAIGRIFVEGKAYSVPDGVAKIQEELV